MTVVGTSLSGAELFWWGCVGGLVAFVLLSALPFIISALEDSYASTIQVAGADVKVPGWRFRKRQIVVLGILILIANGLLGGVAAVIIGDASRIGQAMVFGIAWPTILRGAGNGVGLSKSLLQASGNSDAPATNRFGV